jgi:hypothetical protein
MGRRISTAPVVMIPVVMTIIGRDRGTWLSPSSPDVRVPLVCSVRDADRGCFARAALRGAALRLARDQLVAERHQPREDAREDQRRHQVLFHQQEKVQHAEPRCNIHQPVQLLPAFSQPPDRALAGGERQRHQQEQRREPTVTHQCFTTSATMNPHENDWSTRYVAKCSTA